MCKQAKWDDPELTERVAWAMGVEAASKEYDASPIPTSGKCVGCEPTKIDWYNWKHERKCAGITERWGRPFDLYQQFRNGWQSQRSLLLGEYLAKHLGNAMSQFRVGDITAERVLEAFIDEVKLDEWFIGAGE